MNVCQRLMSISNLTDFKTWKRAVRPKGNDTCLWCYEVYVSFFCAQTTKENKTL